MLTSKAGGCPDMCIWSHGPLRYVYLIPVLDHIYIYIYLKPLNAHQQGSGAPRYVHLEPGGAEVYTSLARKEYVERSTNTSRRRVSAGPTIFTVSSVYAR